MLDRVGTAAVGLLCILLAFGFVALRADFRERIREIYLKHFGNDYRPSLFALYLIAFVFFVLGASLVARAIRGEVL
ncbi:hypothetical protein [Vitreimonas flagellata]|uniref:hypothetical protein n=1 Tax=Vitreimonas flagellata TaxID=2560861 RepID=UPI001074BAD5|nr:hypothetical protein [Vitreimonas flagellata]